MKRRIYVAIVSLSLVFVAPTAGAVSGHLEGYIPAVANGEGRFGSFWTTDVWIYHQGAGVVHLWFNPTGQDNTDGQSVVVELDAPVTVPEMTEASSAPVIVTVICWMLPSVAV